MSLFLIAVLTSLFIAACINIVYTIEAYKQLYKQARRIFIMPDTDLVNLHVIEIREPKLCEREGRTVVLTMPVAMAYTLIELLLDVDELPSEPWTTALPGGHRTMTIEQIEQKTKNDVTAT